MSDERKRAGVQELSKVVSILLSVIWLTLVTGCSSNDRPGSESVTVEKRNEASPASEVGTTITDAYGEWVELGPDPSFISLAPNLTEIVYALGAEDRLLARTDFCDYPPEVAGVESVGTLGTYNFERIVALSPDIILMMTFDGSSRKEYDRLRELGLRPVAFSEGDLPSVIRTIDSVGMVIGRGRRAKGLTDGMRRELDSLRRLTASSRPVPVFVVIDQAPLMTVSGGFITSMVEAAGGRNVAEGNPIAYPRYSREALLRDQPEVILIPSLDSAAPAAFLERYPEAAQVPAGIDGRIAIIPPNLIARPGPRIIQGVLAIRSALHPSR